MSRKNSSTWSTPSLQPGAAGPDELARLRVKSLFSPCTMSWDLHPLSGCFSQKPMEKWKVISRAGCQREGKSIGGELGLPGFKLELGASNEDESYFYGGGERSARNTRKAVQVGPGRASSPGTWCAAGFFLLSSACTEVAGDGSCQGTVLSSGRQSMGLKGPVRLGSCLLHLLAGEGAARSGSGSRSCPGGARGWERVSGVAGCLQLGPPGAGTLTQYLVT